MIAWTLRLSAVLDLISAAASLILVRFSRSGIDRLLLPNVVRQPLLAAAAQMALANRHAAGFAAVGQVRQACDRDAPLADETGDLANGYFRRFG